MKLFLTLEINEILMNPKNILVISISGGKDGQAMASALVKAKKENNWLCNVVLVHADLGRVEWKETPAQVEAISKLLFVPLVVVKHEKYDLLGRWQDRMKKLEGTGKPFWSSAKNRYCTSDMKREPINKFLRTFTDCTVISAEGIRAEESPNRAKKNPFSIRVAISNSKRTAYTWYPIFEASTENVWLEIGHTIKDLKLRQKLYRDGLINTALNGFKGHPAYVYGNERLSCSICILGSKNDLTNGVKHNPDLANSIASMEKISGFTFRQDLSITNLILQ